MVFPFQVPSDYKEVAEDAWWDVRDLLTQSKLFLVASKDFLLKKDVFQPRAYLEPADAIILGRLLDAEVLLTTRLQGRELTMMAYEGKRGRLLWKQKMDLTPSLPVKDQIRPASKKLLYDFIASIPYQGFVVRDALKKDVVYQEQEASKVKVYVGERSQARLSQKAQFVLLKDTSFDPLFQGGGQLEVFAEGHIVELAFPHVIVQLDRVSEEKIKEHTLVFIPEEQQRLRKSYALVQDVYKNVSARYFRTKLRELKEEESRLKPLYTSLAWFGNLALIILLAF
ncbi:MAG: hypothetical protein D6797_02930 [Bdellovibrio sp.]|nr:MAG: hypothetical protein D6797_02930 [Bdellovibrio sp.]